MALIWPKNVNFYHRFACKSKLNAVYTSQSKDKQTWCSWCLMPIGTIQHLNTQRTLLSNSSLLVANVVYGNWRWQPQQNLLNSVFIPCMSASVIEWRSIGSFSSSGLCAGVLITGSHFQLLLTLPPSDTKCQSRGIGIIFKNLFYNTD